MQAGVDLCASIGVGGGSIKTGPHPKKMIKTIVYKNATKNK